jgi:predicted transcriptional regulator/DNA-binding XRE family transcriptional regulator
MGKRVRALRTREGLTQAALAKRLGISPSYLNLIEHDQRSVSANVLLRLAQAFDLDLRAFAATEDRKLIADLMEVFVDPVFEERRPTESDLREFVASSPEVARAVIRLHHAYDAARGSAESLAAQAVERQDLEGMDRAGLSAEQVSELIQRHGNHFPSLEEEAERIWSEVEGEGEDLYAGLAGYLERAHGVTIRIRKVSEMGAAVRRYDRERRVLMLSEALRRGSRNFQLAHQAGLLDGSDAMDRIARDPMLTTEESRALCRVVLANYFAAAVLMPYEPFQRAAEEERYDLELLGHRFRASYEQIAHRVTTLQREGARGVAFHIVRIDIAGNISKKFSATGVRLPRFGGLCPLWNVQAAFLQPGRIRTQLSRLPDGTTFFEIARTVRKHRGGWNAPDVNYAIGLGCSVEDARRLVYAGGVDLANPAAAAPVGITCRLCERIDCRARAFPSVHQPLRINENVRGISFFAPVEES